ncbi:hypothetical protein M1M96_00490 [Peptococcaceae bacterium]|nr:hypothetical protein [Peptococcaceae bacterium]
MYTTLADALEEKYGFNSIGLCKETIKMWSELGMNYKKIKCNCVWW